jgi:hypothetical protein
MAIGTTDTWAQTRDEICSDALANVGAVGPGETASGQILTFAARALNRIVKAIDADGQFLWRISRATLTTTASTASYSIGATYFAVDDPMSYKPASSDTRTPIYPMTRDEYMTVSDRTITGTPNRYYVERTLSGGRTVLVAYFWPVPDTTSDTIEYAGAARAKDYDTGATTSDFPSSWTTALIYGLTAELGTPFGQPAISAQYRQMFDNEKEKQLAADTEQMGLTLMPFGYGSC